MISWVLAHISVPGFLFISGYLYFRNSPELSLSIYKEKTQRGFHRLVIPYILWNLIFLLTYLLMFAKQSIEANDPGLFVERSIAFIQDNGGLDVMWSCIPLSEERTNLLGQAMVSYGPIMPAFWFIRELIVISLFTPIIYWLAKHMKGAFMLIILACYFTGIWFRFPAVSELTLLFFSAGAYFAIHQKNIIKEFRKIEVPSYLLAILFLLISTYYKGHRGNYGEIGLISFHCFLIIGLVATFNIASRLIESGWATVNRTLSDSVMFVFAFHTIWFMTLINVIIDQALTHFDSQWVELIAYILTPLIKTGICLCLYLLLNKYFPKPLDILIGRHPRRK